MSWEVVFVGCFCYPALFPRQSVNAAQLQVTAIVPATFFILSCDKSDGVMYSVKCQIQAYYKD